MTGTVDKKSHEHKTFRIIIEYDGTDFHGWQKQKNDRTIQADIEAALSTMTGEEVIVHGSGRTDAGVHALGQTAHFKCRTRIKAVEFLKGLNSLLDPAIVIKHCEQVAPDFHARYDAKSKIYQYRILNRPLSAAIGRQYAWHIRYPLQVVAMQSACTHLIGKHDFKTFEGAGSPRSHTIRHVIHAEFMALPDELLVFEIEANGFLRYMVRSIVGTLVEVGKGKTSPKGFSRLLHSKNRSKAGVTAPPHGLFLKAVTY